MKIDKFMSKPAVTLLPTNTIKDAVNLMKEKKIGSIIVVDNDRMPINIITTKDILNLIETDFHIDASQKLSEIPHKKNLITIFNTDSYDDALALITANYIHHLIVIDNSGVVVGILSTRDLMEAQKTLNRFFPYFPNSQLTH